MIAIFFNSIFMLIFILIFLKKSFIYDTCSYAIKKKDEIERVAKANR